MSTVVGPLDLLVHARQHRRLTLEEVRELVSLSKSKIYALIQQESFPPPVKTGRASRWVLSEVTAYLADQESNRV